MTAESDPEDVVISGILAKIRGVEDGGAKLQLELINGVYVAVETDTPFEEVKKGQIAIFSEKDRNLRVVPSNLWPSQAWIGVVKAKLNEREYVIDTGGRLIRAKAKRDLEISIGNTVEGRQPGRIAEVLSEQPIRYLDLGEIDDQTIAAFKHKRNSDVSFEDIGGYQSVVDRAKELVLLPLQRQKELEAIGVVPARGGLFTGDPGTGKTLLARAIANEVEANFYEVSGPQVLSKWYGQSEELLRKIFDDAAENPPSIIFFDEIDSIAGQRANDSHEASKKVVAQLLTSMDGFKGSKGVVVIATTNRPQDIDVALLRPGRFDWVIDFPAPDEADRLDILKKRQPVGVTGDIDLAGAAVSTDGWSPADLAAIWTNAGMIAAGAERSKIDSEDFKRGLARVARQIAEKRSARGMEA